MSNKETGDKGEKAAKEVYISKGFTVVCENYRFRRYGEIDLILKKKDLLVFCEVKCRRNPDVYSPAAAVTPDKIRKIRMTASAFLQSHPEYTAYNIRFDVAEGILRGENAQISIIENAF